MGSRPGFRERSKALRLTCHRRKKATAPVWMAHCIRWEAFRSRYCRGRYRAVPRSKAQYPCWYGVWTQAHKKTVDKSRRSFLMVRVSLKDLTNPSKINDFQVGSKRFYWYCHIIIVQKDPFHTLHVVYEYNFLNLWWTYKIWVSFFLLASATSKEVSSDSNNPSPHALYRYIRLVKRWPKVVPHGRSY